MFNRLLYLVLGGLCGLAVPINWLLWRAFSAKRDWWTLWLKSEFHHHGLGYAVTAFWCAVLLGAIGYWLGHSRDEMEIEARLTRDSNVELNELAATDALTNLLNTRAIHERLAIEVEGAHDRLAPLCCLLIDVDHFKKINDTHGHPYGDHVLVTVAKILRRRVRHLDAVGRMGGEEFLVVMPNTAKDIAAQAAERIRHAVETEPFSHENKPVRVTVSIGVARFPTEGLRDKEDLVKAVDQALYAAKKKGRNRVELS